MNKNIIEMNKVHINHFINTNIFLANLYFVNSYASFHLKLKLDKN